MADQTNQTNDASDRAGLTNRTESSAPGALSAAQLVQNYGQLPEDGNVEAVRLAAATLLLYDAVADTHCRTLQILTRRSATVPPLTQLR